MALQCGTGLWVAAGGRRHSTAVETLCDSENRAEGATVCDQTHIVIRILKAWYDELRVTCGFCHHAAVMLQPVGLRPVRRL